MGRLATATERPETKRAEKRVASRARPRIARFPPTPDINPYQRLLYYHLGELGFELDATAVFTLSWLWRGRRRPAYLHFHWRIDRLYRRPLPSWLGSALFALRLRAARLLGYRLVWTIHQPYPHDADENRLDRVAARLLARSCHLLFAHDDGQASTARAVLGSSAAARIAVVPHGSYVGVYQPGRSRAVAELFAACDAKVLARGDGWTSGSLILALSQGLPVVAASTPAYRKLLDEGSAGWLFAPGDIDSPRDALWAAAADRALAARKGAAALAIAHTLSWSRTAQLTAEALQRS